MRKQKKLVSVTCPDCGPVMVKPDIFDFGVPISGVCPSCDDRLHFALSDVSGEDFAHQPKEVN